MAQASLTRSVRFRAAHHYRRPDWTAEQNRRAYGRSVEPHEHEYTLDVTVQGDLDPGAGFLVDLDALDRVIEEVVEPLRGRNLVDAIDEARQGRLLPSTEGLARWFFIRLETKIPGAAVLRRIRVAESDALAAEFPAG